MEKKKSQLRLKVSDTNPTLSLSPAHKLCSHDMMNYNRMLRFSHWHFTTSVSFLLKSREQLAICCLLFKQRSFSYIDNIKSKDRFYSFSLKIADWEFV